MKRRYLTMLGVLLAGGAAGLWAGGLLGGGKVEAQGAPPAVSLDAADSSRPPAGVQLVKDPFEGPVKPRGRGPLLDPRVFRTRPIDLKAWFPQERASLGSPTMRKGFPALGVNYVVLGPSAKKYNCIAWTLDITDRWVWPGDKVSSFDSLYAQVGYKRLTKADYRVVRGYEKIVLYGKVTDRQATCTHGAYQAPDGKWTSKLGQMALIAHDTPEALNGSSYGRPLFVYMRKKPSATPGSPPPSDG